MTRSRSYAAATAILVLLFSVSSVAAQPVEGAPSDVGPEQAPNNISNKTDQGLLTQIPGLSNDTLPATISMPDQASDMAKTVTDTVGQAFSSAVDGIGSFLSENLPIIGGPDGDSDQPVNRTNSTQ